MMKVRPTRLDFHLCHGLLYQHWSRSRILGCAMGSTDYLLLFQIENNNSCAHTQTHSSCSNRAGYGWEFEKQSRNSC